MIQSGMHGQSINECRSNDCRGNETTPLIRRTFTYIDETNFLMLYKALVRPHLEYANSVWNPSKNKHNTSLEHVQRRATKLIPGLKDMTYKKRLRERPFKLKGGGGGGGLWFFSKKIF